MSMDKQGLIDECLKMEGSLLCFPFDATTAVIKTAEGKMFAYADFVSPEKIKKNCGADAPAEDGDIFITLKCLPELIEPLRQQYAAVIPGYYANKNHWNTVIINKDVPTEELRKMILTSFELVSPKKKTAKNS